MTDYFKKAFWIIVFVFVFELATFLLILSGDAIKMAIHTESQMIEAMYGPVAYEKIQDETKSMYKNLVVDTELKKSIYRYFNLEEAYRIPRSGLQKAHRFSYPWLLDRIDVFILMLAWLFRRFILFSMWFWACLPAFGIALFNGQLQWRINQTNFAFSSPFLRILGWKTSATLLGMGMVSFVLPFPLPPIIIPFAIITVSLLLGLTLANITKRF